MLNALLSSRSRCKKLRQELEQLKQEAADRATEELLSRGDAPAPSHSLVSLAATGPRAASTPSWAGQGSDAYREAFPSLPGGAAQLSFADSFVEASTTQQEG